MNHREKQQVLAASMQVLYKQASDQFVDMPSAENFVELETAALAYQRLRQPMLPADVDAIWSTPVAKIQENLAREVRADTARLTMQGNRKLG